MNGGLDDRKPYIVFVRFRTDFKGILVREEKKLSSAIRAAGRV